MNVKFSSTLLVPVPDDKREKDLFFAGVLHGCNENCTNDIVIIVFNACSKLEFVPMLTRKLEEFRQLSTTQSIDEMIFIEKTLEQLAVPLFVKQPDRDMLLFVARMLAVTEFVPEDVIYLSGVAQITENNP